MFYLGLFLLEVGVVMLLYFDFFLSSVIVFFIYFVLFLYFILVGSFIVNNVIFCLGDSYLFWKWEGWM